MKHIEQSISYLTESLFPSFYQEEGEAFIDFVKAYYVWLETEGSESRRILDYADIDSTIDEFIDHFRQQYLNTIPVDSKISQQFLVKHIQELYKNKGSRESYKLLFRLLFDEDIEIYDPGDNILKASDGIWIVPKYLECTRSDRSFSMYGKEVRGVLSGARALCTNVVRKRISGRFIDILYITNIKGKFVTGELVTDDNNLENAPLITGSMNFITITDGGANNQYGDVFTVAGTGGKEGTAVVRSTTSGTGVVDFKLLDGGYGYQLDSNVYVSNTVLVVDKASLISPFDTIEQPLQRLQYTNLTNNSLIVMEGVKGYNASAVEVANGYILQISSATANTGNVYISDTGGNWGAAVYISKTSNPTVTANVIPNNITATATVVGTNGVNIGVTGVSNILFSNGFINVITRRPIGLTTTSLTANTLTGNNTEFTNVLSANDLIYIRSNGNIVGRVASVANNTSAQLQANASQAVSNSTLWSKRTVITSNTGRVYNNGSGAYFSVGSLTDTENVVLSDVLIDSLNSNNVNFLDMLVSGSNSTLPANAYGFPANTSISLNGVVYSTFTSNNKTVGKILSLQGINPGVNYTANPIVKIVEPDTYSLYEQNVALDASSIVGIYPGDTLTQQYTLPRTLITTSANTSNFKRGEGIQQLTTGANGILISTSTGQIIIDVVSGTFTTGFNIQGISSGVTGTTTAVTNFNETITAKGYVENVTSNTITVKRASLLYNFKPNILATTAQGSAFITGVNIIDNSLPAGINADVSSKVSVAQGIASTVEVLTSGYGYSDGDTVTLTSVADSNSVIYGVVSAQTHGSAEGFWRNNQGKLNSDMYIHDNKYYQEYSYEIRSRLSLSNYSDVLKKLLHVSGTAMYGKTIVEGNSEIPVYGESSITISN